jgi:hypothetical protein
LNQQKNEIGGSICLIPLAIGVFFVLMMIFFAVISTEKAREHYQAKKLQESIHQVSQIKIGSSNPAIRMLENSSRSPDTTPTPTPAREKTLFEQMDYYEIYFPITALGATIFGLRLFGLVIGIYKVRNRSFTAKTPLFLRNVWAMFALMCFSFALLLLYIWALRIGLIG